MQKIVKNEGYLALYKGLSACMLGLIHPIVYFPLYENLKWRTKKKKGKVGSLDIFMISCVSKFIATMTTYPHILLRSRFFLFNFTNEFFDFSNEIYNKFAECKITGKTFKITMKTINYWGYWGKFTGKGELKASISGLRSILSGYYPPMPLPLSFMNTSGSIYWKRSQKLYEIYFIYT